ncbi:unnamed protein product [Alternaria alternata]
MLLHAFLSSSAPAVVKRTFSKRLSYKFVVDVHLKVLASLPGISYQEDIVFGDVNDIRDNDLSPRDQDEVG